MLNNLCLEIKSEQLTFLTDKCPSVDSTEIFEGWQCLSWVVLWDSPVILSFQTAWNDFACKPSERTPKNFVLQDFLEISIWNCLLKNKKPLFQDNEHSKGCSKIVAGNDPHRGTLQSVWIGTKIQPTLHSTGGRNVFSLVLTKVPASH